MAVLVVGDGTAGFGDCSATMVLFPFDDTSQDEPLILFTEKVVRIRETPEGEERVEFDSAQIRDDDKITLRPNSDVDEGDLIELVNPVGKKRLLRVTKVIFNNSPRRGPGNNSTRSSSSPATVLTPSPNGCAL
ncbi:hypothetical protein [Pseudonocardia xinjiangensis]|uniref:Uncharacterized protein n=1 Tax=Pseudonocardia xinjiangensis TaxID=75289 RepID=A0ABX1R888_9PSEU|nr:hypothetical protein [Pseudonocardia xinjiangensis]NMH75670.1 hypothetical protein [Pseudonocardia xinjiangensis]